MSRPTLNGIPLSAWSIPDAVLDLAADEHRPHVLTLGGFIGSVAHLHGPKTALVFEERRWTYDELYAETRLAARALIASGVGKGSRIAVLMSNRPEWVISTFAGALVGAVVTPMSTLATADERAYVLRHSDSSLLLCQASLRNHAYLDDLGELSGKVGALRLESFPELREIVALGTESRHLVTNWDAFLERGREVPDSLLTAVSVHVDPYDDSLIIYTSGTTAAPKGVLHVQRAPVLQSWQWRHQLGLDDQDRVLSPYPFFWTAGFCRVLGSALAAGAAFIMEEIFDAGTTLRLVEREHVTTLPVMTHQDAALAEHPDLAKTDVSSLRRLGASSALAKAIGFPADHEDPGGAFGLSETFTIATSLPSNAPVELRRETHGKALPGMTIAIVDPDTGESLEPGSTGEITLKGITMMRGYYKVEPESVFDANGFFHTKDAGFVDADGYLHWSGRMSGLIKTAGANVSPLEVESAVLDSGLVRAAYAVGLPHPTLGEAVVLCVIRSDLHNATEDDIRAELTKRIAKYKVPRRVEFVAEAEIPFTANEKVQLAGLRALLGKRLAQNITDDGPWQALLVEQYLTGDA